MGWQKHFRPPLGHIQLTAAGKELSLLLLCVDESVMEPIVILYTVSQMYTRRFKFVCYHRADQSLTMTMPPKLKIIRLFIYAYTHARSSIEKLTMLTHLSLQAAKGGNNELFCFYMHCFFCIH